MNYDPALKMVQKKLLPVFFAVVLFASIFILALPIWCDVLIWIFVYFVFKFNRFQVVLVSFLLLLATFVLSYFPEITNLESKKSNFMGPFYREHEKYAQRDGRYKANVKDVIDMPYGDIYVIDAGRNTMREDIKEPRTVEFITDEYGFRNNLYSIKKADVILVGDSFIVANGTTQEKIPANALSKKTGMKVASIAFPGDAKNYEVNIKAYLPYVKKTAKFYVFYFEGNDFRHPRNEYSQGSLIVSLKDNYLWLETKKDLVLSKIYSEDNLFFRKIRAASNSFNVEMLGKNSISYYDINGKTVGFYKDHTRRSISQSVWSHIFKDQDVINRVDGIFLIPTKYRVYSTFMNVQLPDNKAYNFLKEKYAIMGIPVYDLTPSLQKAANQLLGEGEYVFWRDDTHWNQHGIDAAMECVKAVLTSKKESPPADICN